MTRAERLHALVDLLHASGRPLPAARLAREFGVSVRTVERDLVSLRAAGVPVHAGHGARDGYSVLREDALPLLDLTATESLAVLAGLRLLESSPYEAAARRARAKVLAVLAQDGSAARQDALFPMPAVEARPVAADALPGELPADAVGGPALEGPAPGDPTLFDADPSAPLG